MTAEVIAISSATYTSKAALLELLARADQIDSIVCVVTTKDRCMAVVQSEASIKDIAAAAIWLNDHATQLLKAPAE